MYNITEVQNFIQTTPDYVYTDYGEEEEENQEDIQQVLEDMEILLQNDSIFITADEVHHAFDQVDILLEDQQEVEIPGELLHMLDELGSRLDLKGSRTASAVRDNMALMLADADPDHPIRGVRVTSDEDSVFHENSFQFLRDPQIFRSTALMSNDTDAMVFLPESVTSSSRRISFVVFRNDRAFRSKDFRVNSRILSVNVDNFTEMQTGEVVDVYFNPIKRNLRRDESRVCAYWQFFGNGTGQWNQDGCSFIEATEDGLVDICRCDHLTHFAQIIISRDVFSELNEKILEIISVIGCISSINGIIAIAFTAFFFKSWRSNEANRIWLQLSAAVFILDVCFLIVVFVEFRRNNISCIIIGVTIHYALLATFCWMFVVSVFSYRKLVLVFTRDIPKKLLISSIFAWGFPLLIITILLAVNPRSYSTKMDEKSPNGGFCYPSGLGKLLAIYLPITVLWLLNWILYSLIIKSISVNRNIRKHGSGKDSLRYASVSCLLAFVCGIPWIFGLFASNIVAAYLFAITVSFQGFILFIFFVLGTKKTRNLWSNMFRSKFSSKAVYRGFNPNETVRSSVKGSRFYVPKPSTVDEAASELLEESKL